MRHPSKRKRKGRHVPRKLTVVVDRRKGKTRYYRGPNGTVVVWHDGRFTIRTDVRSTDSRSLARMPKGLAGRVDEALRKGLTNG